ncbi:MAG TPA: hypothetical protein VJ934_12420 [Desulfomicrobiaceae bacterium]|nr:hypothetical protein [Desulfomicrobiaceae bacterium]
MNLLCRRVSLVVGLGCLLCLSGCLVTAGGGGGFGGTEQQVGHGPPAHAPAHGYRAKYRYRYYPDARVYFDIARERYFYTTGDRWRVSVSIPDRIRVRMGSSVIIEMDSDRPYLKNHDHVRKYPPGQRKNRGKRKKHGKWN